MCVIVHFFGGNKSCPFSSSFYTHHKQENFSLDLMKHFSSVTQGEKSGVDEISSESNYLSALFSVDLALALV